MLNCDENKRKNDSKKACTNDLNPLYVNTPLKTNSIKIFIKILQEVFNKTTIIADKMTVPNIVPEKKLSLTGLLI
jgi:uncharacterized protein YueI